MLFMNRNIISKELLDVIHEQNMKRNLAIIKNEAEIFGLLFLGDGTTISRFPLSNIQASAKNIPVDVLEIVYCQGHLADDNKKYGIFICNKFLNHMREIDPGKKLTDIVMFDGASNVKLGGKILKVHYTELPLMREVEHTVSLFFNNVSKINIVNQTISAHKVIYNIFGSGIYQNLIPCVPCDALVPLLIKCVSSTVFAYNPVCTI